MPSLLKLLFAVLFLTIPNGVHAQTQTPLVVNYAAINTNMLNLWVGKEANYFAEEELDARILHVRGGSLGVQLLVSGQTPIGLVGATAIANAYLQGSKDLVMIGRTLPDARKLQPAALIDASVVRDAAKGI